MTASKFESYTLATEMWHYSGPADEVPAMLRELAARLESDPGVAFCGAWSTGFGESGEAVLQVIVDHHGPALAPGAPVTPIESTAS